MFSGGDDYHLRLFDFPSESILRTIPNAHNDFIRKIVTVPNLDNTILSSSYDFNVKLFDFKNDDDKP